MSEISPENLYQPEKYEVQTGFGTVGFCTVWNEPKAVIKMAPELREKAALIGTLYSSQGVNVILRNLALNPQIRSMYLWGHGALSQTKFGIVGSNVLKKMWQNGVDEEGRVADTTFKLDKEIDPAVLRKIIENVELKDLSAFSLDESVRLVETSSDKRYMEPVRFPDAVIEEPDTFPSEEIGWIVRGKGIVEAWTRVVERIMRYGTVKGTQYGSQQKELTGVTWVTHFEDPDKPNLPSDWPLSLRETTGATEEAIREYHRVFLSADMPPGVSYTYGNRLMRYPTPNEQEKLDQVTESLIANLKSSPDSRRAVATTLVPWIDAKSSEPPCITQVQCLQAKGKLNFLVTVRSHDIFKAAIPNAFGLRSLQKRIAGETGFEMGVLQITSQSAHIYEADWDNAKKLATCAFWERPVSKITGDDADPRGSFIISLQKDEIVVEFQAQGQTLLRFSGKNADKLALDIAKHELFSQTGHALDIGIQLARAEVALKKGIKFIQDHPL